MEYKAIHALGLHSFRRILRCAVCHFKKLDSSCLQGAFIQLYCGKRAEHKFRSWTGALIVAVSIMIAFSHPRTACSATIMKTCPAFNSTQCRMVHLNLIQCFIQGFKDWSKYLSLS